MVVVVKSQWSLPCRNLLRRARARIRRVVVSKRPPQMMDRPWTRHWHHGDTALHHELAGVFESRLWDIPQISSMSRITGDLGQAH